MSKSKSYWQNRQRQWFNNQDKMDAAAVKRLEAEYRRTSKDLEKDIAGYFQRYGQDNVIEFRTMLQDLSDSDRDLLFQNMDAFAEKYPEHADLLPVRESIYRLNRLEGLHYSTQVKLLELGAVEQMEFEKHLERTYGKRYEQMMKELGIGNNFLSIDDSIMRDTIFTQWVNGENFSDRIWSNKEKLLDHLQNRYRDGLARGDNYNRLMHDVMERFSVGEFDARRLVWTESSFVLNQAHAHAYINADVEEYEISAIMDSKTSEICRDLDGEVFRFDEIRVGVNFPPFHSFCRTAFIGKLDEPSAEDGEELPQPELTDHIKGKLTGEQVETYKGLLENGSPEAQALWEAYKDDLVLYESNARRGAFFKNEQGVTFNATEDLEGFTTRDGVILKRPGNTFFHEFGHHID